MSGSSSDESSTCLGRPESKVTFYHSPHPTTSPGSRCKGMWERRTGGVRSRCAARAAVRQGGFVSQEQVEARRGCRTTVWQLCSPSRTSSIVWSQEKEASDATCRSDVCSS